MIVRNVNGHILVIPEKADIEQIKVGSMAPDPFGGMRIVTEINYSGFDICGKFFCGYTVEFGPQSTITMSIKEHELIRHANHPFNAQQLRDFESDMLREVA